MRKIGRFTLSVMLSSVLFLASFPMVLAQNNTPQQEEDSDYYFVQLEKKPTSTYQGGIKGYKATRVAFPNKLNVKAEHVQKYRNVLKKDQQSYEQWLRKNVKSAKVASRFSLTFDGIAVKAQEADAKLLAKGPGVKRVVRSKKYRPMMNRSNQIIHTQALWRAGYNGSGVKVAVIDSGVDASHPFLKDPTLKVPAGFPKVDLQHPDWTQFTSNKVIVARVFSPNTSATPKALSDHGTHVAGTIAGISNFVDPTGAAKGTLSGVAPKAYLGSYNVFPCPQETEESKCRAESIYIAAAVEAAVNDGMDVANLSLGGSASDEYDLLEEVINSATEAGMVTVVSAGNSGNEQADSRMTIGSPGTAEKAITVGAVTNSHFFSKSIRVNMDGEEKQLAAGSAEPGGEIEGQVNAPLAIVTEGGGTGCTPISSDLTGKVAVIKRGGCTFTEKATHAQEKGAVGVIIVNNVPGDPDSMSMDDSVHIPSVMVSNTDGSWILTKGKGSVVIAPMEDIEFDTSNQVKHIADFSSRGPTPKFLLKPDVAAVGVGVYSSVVGGGFRSFNGTSMSAPHVTGAVALLLQAHPDWTPADVKAALVGTAQDPTSAALPLEVGGGVIDIGKALHPVALAIPSSLSFGQLTSRQQKKLRLTVKNMTSSTLTYTFGVRSSDPLFLSQKSLKLSRGRTGHVDVTVNARFQGKGDHQGYITVSNGSGKKMIRVPYYYCVK